ncbi:MAG TPA: alpha/beta fold hydrolase [Thermoanaerobaculia bacterium]|nr:alpha/beta fold hydrolase [Thermoanaerobaculia bacterium]
MSPGRTPSVGTVALWLAALSSAACFSLRPTETPMPTLLLAEGASESRCLILLLPGRGDAPTDFAAAGFAEIATDQGIAAEVVAVDAHMGYFRDRSVLDRLEADVIAPARRRGVEEIWWVGVSLGGLASLLVLDEHPEAVDGVVLLAPFLGEGPTVESVVAAGELAAWVPDTTLEAGPDGLWRRLWTVLQRETAEAVDGPPLYLGFGDRDRYGDAHRTLAAALPEERVLVLPGGHDWTTWSLLWSSLTADGLPICRRG